MRSQTNGILKLNDESAKSINVRLTSHERILTVVIISERVRERRKLNFNVRIVDGNALLEL